MFISLLLLFVNFLNYNLNILSKYFLFSDILYWADTSDKTIKRSFIPDPAYQDTSSGYAQNLELKGLTKPSALAIDWISEYVSIDY